MLESAISKIVGGILTKAIIGKIEAYLSTQYRLSIREDLFDIDKYLNGAIYEAVYFLRKERLDNHLRGLKTKIKTIRVKSLEKVDDPAEFLYDTAKHPAVLLIKALLTDELHKQESLKERFLKEYNHRVIRTIILYFGSEKSFDIHKTRLRNHLDITITEDRYLRSYLDPVIGLFGNTNIAYEHIYGFAISSFEDQQALTKRATSKLRVEGLIEKYFEKLGDSYHGNILFLVAEFGKGKTVFLEHMMSECAEQHLKDSQFYFPIYFDMRDFFLKKYNPDDPYGIINSYMKVDKLLNLDNEYFRKKNKFIFIDSLDELISHRDFDDLEKCLDSILRINRIDPAENRKTRIIVASRPLGSELNKLFEKYNVGNQSEFYAIYFSAFQKAQFNRWLYKAVSASKTKTHGGIAQKIIEAGANIHPSNFDRAGVDITQYFEGLRKEDLRPLFAFLIYRLIVVGIEISNWGRLEVYLQFLNYISGGAKMTEKAFPNLQQRKNLQLVAAAWNIYNSGHQLNNETVAKLQDNLTFNVKGSFPKDSLYHYENSNNGQRINFQHESFAEILVAEYVVSRLLRAVKFNSPIEEFRKDLLIGEPTNESYYFIFNILELLYKSIEDRSNRALLVPCVHEICRESKRSVNDPVKEVVSHWPINRDLMINAIDYCRNVWNSAENYVMSESEGLKNSLSSLIHIKSDAQKVEFNVDKLLVLVVSTRLVELLNYPLNPSEKFTSHIQSLQNFEHKHVHRELRSVKKSLFKRFSDIKVADHQYLYDDFRYRVFSKKGLKNIKFYRCDLKNVSFLFCRFDQVSIEDCRLDGAHFLLDDKDTIVAKNISPDFVLKNCEFTTDITVNFDFQLFAKISGEINLHKRPPKDVPYEKRMESLFYRLESQVEALKDQAVLEKVAALLSSPYSLLIGLFNYSVTDIVSFWTFESKSDKQYFTKVLSEIHADFGSDPGIAS